MGFEAARLITRTVLPPPPPVDPSAFENPKSRAIAELVLAHAPARGAEAWTSAPTELRSRAVDLAGAARVDLLLASTLRAFGLEVPDALATRAAAAKAAAAWAWVEGAAILDALERAGLAPIALKGADLSARAYPAVFPQLPDRAYLRHATDLDILLARPEAAATVMREEGFVEDKQGASHHIRWRKPGGALSFSVELHDDLFDKPHGLCHSIEAIRASAVTVTSPDGGTRRVLAPLDAFLHVAGHAVYSDLLRDPVAALRGPIDLAVLAAVQPLHTVSLLKTAVEMRFHMPVMLAIRWSEMLGAALPPSVSIVSRTHFHGTSLRRLWGKRRVLANARAALEGKPSTRGPATVWRALLAPTLASAVAMLREGFRRRRSAM